jgi:hypothetical protein
MSEALPLMDDSGPMGSANVKHLCRMALGGAGQVTIAGNYAYLGYMYGPEGTSILDISDPRDPKLLTTIMLENKRSHSHKVRVVGEIMVVNSEERPVTGEPYDDGGVRIYDIADKSNPWMKTTFTCRPRPRASSAISLKFTISATRPSRRKCHNGGCRARTPRPVRNPAP